MKKEELIKHLNEGDILPEYYSLGYEIKNNACNIHSLPNGKFELFELDERGGNKKVIKTNISSEEEAFDKMYEYFEWDINYNKKRKAGLV